MDALGPVLADFTRAVVEATRCAEATAAQSALAVACLAAQAHADVVTPAGLSRPLSLFMVTIAASGERKSAADTYALAPVREIEAEDREVWKRDYQSWRNRHDAWEAQRTRIKRDAKSDAEGKRESLDALGREPLPPLRPERTVDDATTEGLIKSWTDCHGSRGLFTAEGAKVMAGHSMSDEARMRSAATFSGLWDNGRAERIRAGEGCLSLRGRRLATHLMAQPGVAAAFLNAADLRDQGLIGRFLICEAPEQAGARLFREPPPRGDPRFVAYGDAIRRLLRGSPRTFDGRNELDPRALLFSQGAMRAWRELHDHIEVRLGSAGELGGVKSFGNKLAEHAARIAGVLTILQDPDALEIGAEVMGRVGNLAEFYAAEAARLNTEADIARPLADAEKLRVWLIEKWPEPLISIPDATQRGPYGLRAKATMDQCFAVLEEHGWLTAEGPGEIGGVKRQETFAVRRPGVAP
ncbi:MAG: YfjI family protein [Pseudomonadota bacterium]